MTDAARDVVVSRALRAPAAVVWRALVEPAALAGWFWPTTFGTVANLDARPGGRFSIRSASAGIGASGHYRAVEAPARLEFSWRWDGDDDESTVQVALAGSGANTTVTLTNSGLPDEAARDRHAQGWSDCLDRLVNAAGHSVPAASTKRA